MQVELRRRNGSVSGLALVDAKNFEFLKAMSWHKSPAGYAVHGATKAEPEYPRGTKIFMHRLVLGLAKCDPRLVDHINGDKLDNRRSNLRLLRNDIENGQNRKPNVGHTYRGIYFDKRLCLWRARLQVDRKRVHVGYFETKRLAAIAVAQARKEMMPYTVEELC